MITMSENIIHTKEKARSHIVEAMTLIHFVEGVKKGDYPEQQKIYYAEINKAKNLLKKVYSPNNVIFNELNIHSNIGLNAALGTLNVRDEPFIDMKESNSDTFHAETYNGQIKNLVLEYAEAVHPNDEAQQDYLMDMIVSGEYQISIIEMQRKIENPTANQSRGREKVLASEGFDAETFEAQSKPHSVDVSRSTNKEKKLMAVFENKEGNKIKTTHFGARGMSDYTKHGDKDRMKLYESRHKKNEHWNRPMTAGSLSKNILWNTPSLAGSFNDYKRRFGLKGDLKVSRSAESYGADWSIDTNWGEPDMEQNNDDWGIDWDSNDIGYTPEMLKAKRMKNRYIPPNFNVQRKDGRKYLFLDFDNTVRHTIPDPKPDEPKRRRPPHKAEEVYMIGCVAEKVREWANAGYFIIGLTNQSNIESGYNTTNDVVSAIKRTLDLLGMQFPVYFASHKNKSLPDYNFRKPMTGMIDAALSDFGSADRTYSVMVGDDWEYADSGMARNAGVHFIGVLPFLNMTVKEAKNAMFMGTQDGEIISLLNPDDLIPTFAKEYDNLMGGTIQSAESSYSKSPTLKSSDNMAMKMSMGTIVGVIGGLLLGYNAPALWSKYMSKGESAAESSIGGEQALANQGFIEDWSGGNEGDDNLSSQGNKASPAGVSYHYDPLATPDAMAHDPATRPPSFM